MAEFKESEHPRDKDGKFTDKGSSFKEFINRRNRRKEKKRRKEIINKLKSKRLKRKIGLQFFANKEKQFGKKLGRHAKDFGLDPSLPADREFFQKTIDNIIANSTEVRIGEWRGQSQEVLFHILGDDVVLTKQNNEFISILKGGINNARVMKARNR